MPSSENATLLRIQQEIQDVVERERELKKLNNVGNGYGYPEDEDSSEEQKPTLTRIQEEIQNVMQRERELKKLQNNGSGFSSIDNNEDSAGEDFNGDHTDHSSNHSDAGSSHSTAKSDEVDLNANQRQHKSLENGQTQSKTGYPGGIGGVVRAALLRAKSTSVLEDTTAPAKPSFRRLLSANPHKGVMHRFLKSRGKLQAVNALTLTQDSAQPKTPFANMPNANGYNHADHYELLPPKVAQGQFLRKNFIPTEKKIKQDIEATYKRETELKTLRQSQGNLTLLDDAQLDAPLENYGLRASKSMAALYNSDENLDEAFPTGSAPSSLKPAKSLAELCDAKDEEVTSPQALITHFQQMIIKNQESKRT